MTKTRDATATLVPATPTETPEATPTDAASRPAPSQTARDWVAVMVERGRRLSGPDTTAHLTQGSTGSTTRSSTVSRVVLQVLQWTRDSHRLFDYFSKGVVVGLEVRGIVDATLALASLDSEGYSGPEVTTDRVARALANAEGRGEVRVDRSRRPYSYAWLYPWERQGGAAPMPASSRQPRAEASGRIFDAPRRPAS